MLCAVLPARNNLDKLVRKIKKKLNKRIRIFVLLICRLELVSSSKLTWLTICTAVAVIEIAVVSFIQTKE